MSEEMGKVTLENATLSQVRDAYFEKRWEVRRRIIDGLQDDPKERFKIKNIGSVEFKKNYRPGHGSSTYVNHGNSMIAAFDLSGWQFITVDAGFSELLISLQAFDKDAKTGNRHVLDGRIQFRCENPELYVVTQFDVHSLTEEQITGPNGLIEQFGKFYDITEELHKPLLGETDPQISDREPGQWQWSIHYDNPWQ
jgi:hypothetical protein